MNNKQIRIIKTIALTLICSLVTVSNARVDPTWLKEWNIAVDKRPENLSSISRIAPKEEPGTPFVINGQIFKPDGLTPISDLIVQAYHRDTNGYDYGSEDNSTKTWRLQGWAKTDSDGKFKFNTIRPAPDHLGREGAHIHFTIVSTEFGRQWGPTIYLLDDPQVSKRQKEKSRIAGQFSKVREVKMINGIQNIKVNIKLKEKADF